MRRTPGMASTILPVTFHVDPAATVGDLARAIDARLVATLRHGRFRGEDLAREVRAIDPDRRVFGPGINSMMFEHVLEFDGNPARIRGSVTGPVHDLDFSIQGGEDGEPIRIDLRAPAGQREELLRHEERLAHFVSQFLRNPMSTVGELEPMTDEERRRVLLDWNDTAEPQPSHTVPELFADAVRLDPDAEALVAGDLRLTYRELAERVAQLAHHLRDRGLAPEEVVAVGLPARRRWWSDSSRSSAPAAHSFRWIRRGRRRAASPSSSTPGPGWCSPDRAVWTPEPTRYTSISPTGRTASSRPTCRRTPSTVAGSPT